MGDELSVLQKRLSVDRKLLHELSILTSALAVGFVPHPERPLEFAPLRHALLPRRFSRRLFDHVCSLTPLLHRLLDGVRKDVQWLLVELAQVAAVDPFVKRLCDLVHKVYVVDDKAVEDVEVFSLRTDYMTTDDERRILQVEINTISAGFACISQRLSQLHRLTVHKLADSELNSCFPSHVAGQSLAKALVKSHELFLEAHPADEARRQVRLLFVVEEVERNEVDQRLLEIALFEAGELVVDRLTLAEIGAQLTVDTVRSCLTNSATNTVYSVVYFRSGYAPEQYAV